MADELWVRLRRETVEALAELLDNEAQGYARVTQARNIARLLREDAGERFYPEPPKPAPERVGAVAKRARDRLGESFVHEDWLRLLACAEASDEYVGCRSAGTEAATLYEKLRRTVTGETT